MENYLSLETVAIGLFFSVAFAFVLGWWSFPSPDVDYRSLETVAIDPFFFVTFAFVLGR